MAANLRLIETTWNAILPRLREEKCAGCECLQGALMEIRLALEDLPPSAAQGATPARGPASHEHPESARLSRLRTVQPRQYPG